MTLKSKFFALPIILSGVLTVGCCAVTTKSETIVYKEANGRIIKNEEQDVSYKLANHELAEVSINQHVFNIIYKDQFNPRIIELESRAQASYEGQGFISKNAYAHWGAAWVFDKQNYLYSWAEGQDTLSHNVPKHGRMQYKGTMIMHTNLRGGDSLMETAPISFDVDFDQKTVRAVSNKIKFIAQITDNGFATNALAQTQVKGAFYGNRAQAIAGEFNNQSQAVMGSFGAQRNQ